MYLNGEGVPQDYPEALNWFRKAAEQGLASAQGNLGYMYHNGKGVPQNYAEAIKGTPKPNTSWAAAMKMAEVSLRTTS
jgi:TPR repeat protein